MKIILTGSELKDIYKVCKKAVAKTDRNPILQWVQLKIHNGILTATALDGFRVHQFKLETSSADCEMYIPIINIPSRKFLLVEIEQVEKTVVFSYEGKKETFVLYNGDYPNWENFLPKDEALNRVYLDPKFLRDACDAMIGEKYICIELRGELKPVMIKSEVEDKQVLLLPVRPPKSKVYSNDQTR